MFESANVGKPTAQDTQIKADGLAPAADSPKFLQPFGHWRNVGGPPPPQGLDQIPTAPPASIWQHLPDASKLLPQNDQSKPAQDTTRSAQSELPKPAAGNDNEPEYDKIGREALVLGAGLGRSIIYGMASLPSRAPEIGASVAIGATLSTISKTGGVGAAATLIVGAYFTSKFLVNAFEDTGRWQKFGDAVSDTWNRNDHIMKNIRDVSDSGGNFVFDSGLSYASGYMGYKNKALADLILQVIRVPMPVPVPGIPPKFPLPPALMGASAYMAAVPAPILYGHRPVRDSTPKEEKEEDQHH